MSSRFCWLPWFSFCLALPVGFRGRCWTGSWIRRGGILTHRQILLSKCAFKSLVPESLDMKTCSATLPLMQRSNSQPAGPRGRGQAMWRWELNRFRTSGLAALTLYVNRHCQAGLAVQLETWVGVGREIMLPKKQYHVLVSLKFWERWLGSWRWWRLKRLHIPLHFLLQWGLSKAQFQGAWDKSTGCFGQEPEFQSMIPKASVACSPCKKNGWDGKHDTICHMLMLLSFQEDVWWMVEALWLKLWDAPSHKKIEIAVLDRGQMPITHDSHDFMKKHPVGHDENLFIYKSRTSRAENLSGFLFAFWKSRFFLTLAIADCLWHAWVPQEHNFIMGVFTVPVNEETWEPVFLNG